jgi:transcriptional regulator GlxA family with amidase domain
MQVAIALYDRFAVLDAIGPYQVLSALPGLEVVLTAQWRGPVTDEGGGAAVSAVATLDEVPRPDIVIVPGGPGQADHMTPGPLPDWLVAVDQSTVWTAAVCTGALILAGAGLLDGREATTHWLAKEELARLGAKPANARYVFDGKYATSAGMSAGIDMALALAARIAGDDAAMAVQLGMEYDPQPPFTAGSPATAPAALVAAQRAASRFRAAAR